MISAFLFFLQSEEAIVPEEPIQLFNGKDLSGFHSWLSDTKREDPRGVFGVDHGTIRISGDGLGYLATEKTYRDYCLSVEFRWGRLAKTGRQTWARDSGLFVHAIGPDGNSYDGNGAYMAGIEVQIMQGSTGDLMLIAGKDERGKRYPLTLTSEVGEKDKENWPWWKRGGSPFTLYRFGRINWSSKDPEWKNVSGFRGKRDVESVETEWTKLECTCVGNRIVVKVNGILVNEASDVFPDRGRVLLQCEGFEVFFRNLVLSPLPKDSFKEQNPRH